MKAPTGAYRPVLTDQGFFALVRGELIALLVRNDDTIDWENSGPPEDLDDDEIARLTTIVKGTK